MLVRSGSFVPTAMRSSGLGNESGREDAPVVQNDDLSLSMSIHRCRLISQMTGKRCSRPARPTGLCDIYREPPQLTWHIPLFLSYISSPTDILSPWVGSTATLTRLRPTTPYALFLSPLSYAMAQRSTIVPRRPRGAQGHSLS